MNTPNKELSHWGKSNLGVMRAAREERANKDLKIKELQRQADLAAYQERMRPLVDRLKELLAKIPDEVKNAGLPIATLQERLKGRFRGQANIIELAKALRKLGYERQRKWHSSEGFRALWYPAGMAPVKPAKRSKNT